MTERQPLVQGFFFVIHSSYISHPLESRWLYFMTGNLFRLKYPPRLDSNPQPVDQETVEFTYRSKPRPRRLVFLVPSFLQY